MESLVTVGERSRRPRKHQAKRAGSRSTKRPICLPSKASRSKGVSLTTMEAKQAMYQVKTPEGNVEKWTSSRFKSRSPKGVKLPSNHNKPAPETPGQSGFKADLSEISRQYPPANPEGKDTESRYITQGEDGKPLTLPSDNSCTGDHRQRHARRHTFEKSDGLHDGRRAGLGEINDDSRRVCDFAGKLRGGRSR